MMVTDEFNNSTSWNRKNRVIHIFQNVFQFFCRIFDLQYDMKNGKVRKGLVKGQTEVN